MLRKDKVLDWLVSVKRAVFNQDAPRGKVDVVLPEYGIVYLEFAKIKLFFHVVFEEWQVPREEWPPNIQIDDQIEVLMKHRLSMHITIGENQDQNHMEMQRRNPDAEVMTISFEEAVTSVRTNETFRHGFGKYSDPSI